MDYQFHQTIVFILMAIYVPLIMTNFILMVKGKNKSDYLCYGLITIGLIFSLPSLMQRYQQYLMGYFSGLPEIITTTQSIYDVIVIIMFLLIIGICICTYINSIRYNKKIL